MRLALACLILPWVHDRRPGRATMVCACVWLAVLSSCDAMKSEQKSHEYQHALVTELCAPGEFYPECWWTNTEFCHREMPFFVANSMPDDKDRVAPSEAMRQQVLENVYWLHTSFVAATRFMWKFDKVACWDGTPWKHVPPGKEGKMTEVRERVEKRRAQREAPSASTTTDTPPAPSPGSAPEPSPGPVPEPAPAP